jgi:hypothetical protein
MIQELPKYEYYLKVWGGFWNEANLKVHGIPETEHLYFSTKEAREEYLEMLEETRKSLGTWDATIARYVAEGYHVRTIPVCHRISEYKGKRVHTIRDWSFPESNKSVLEYHMEYKWYPGFNDYPFGEDERIYDGKQVTIIAEWIEGAFETT